MKKFNQSVIRWQHPRQQRDGGANNVANWPHTISWTSV